MSKTESGVCSHNRVSARLFMHHRIMLERLNPEAPYRETERELVDPRDSGEGPWFFGAICDDCDESLTEVEIPLDKVQDTGIDEGYADIADFWALVLQDLNWYKDEISLPRLTKALDFFRNLEDAEQFEQLFQDALAAVKYKLAVKNA